MAETNHVESSKLALLVLDFVNERRQRHGIKNEEYANYRKYCSKRLRVLRRQLRPSNFKSYKYVKDSFPSVISDVRHLEFLVIWAERCWSQGMHLKLKYENASCTNAHGRHYFIRKFARAWRLSRRLLSYCEQFGDANTCNNAKIYASFMQGIYQLESGDYAAAHVNLSTFASILNQKQLASNDVDYSVQLAPVNALVRLAAFHLRARGASAATSVVPNGVVVDHEVADGNWQENAKLLVVQQRQPQHEDIGVYCNGRPLAIESQMLVQQVCDLLSVATDGLLPSDADLAKYAISQHKVLEKLANLAKSKHGVGGILEPFDELLISFSNVIDAIQHEHIAQTRESEANIQQQRQQALLQQLHHAMALLRQHVELEKHLLLQLLFLQKLDEDPSLTPKCDEGLRYSRIIKQQLSGLLKESKCSAMMQMPMEICKRANALIMGVAQLAISKDADDYAKSLALISWSYSRRNLRVNTNADEITNIQWRCLFMFQLLQEAISLIDVRMQKRATAMLIRATYQLNNDNELEIKRDLLTSLGIRHRGVACKPILFDLSFMEHGPPNLAVGTLQGVKGMFASFFKKQ